MSHPFFSNFTVANCPTEDRNVGWIYNSSISYLFIVDEYGSISLYDVPVLIRFRNTLNGLTTKDIELGKPIHILF